MERPRIKSVFPPIPVGGGSIRIGGADHGLAAELTDDDDGHLWQLLTLLDGSRTRAEVIAALRDVDPAVPAADVEAALAALEDAGFLDDAAVEPPPGAFSPDELARYARNLDFWSYFHMPPVTPFDVQARLKSARVTVLGVGGLGSYVALSLAAAGVGDILVVDHDTVEASNLNRQVLYTDADVGRSKVVAAKERLEQINPHVSVTAWDHKVTGVEDARACFAGRDLVVCAADRPRVLIYEWLNAAALAEGVPWIRGANDGLTVNVFLHVPDETACFACEQLGAHEENPWYGNALRYAMDVIGDRTVNPCTAPVAGLIGNLTALEAVKQLTGICPPTILGRKLIFELRSFEIRFAEGRRRDDCPACGLPSGLDLAS